MVSCTRLCTALDDSLDSQLNSSHSCDTSTSVFSWLDERRLPISNVLNLTCSYNSHYDPILIPFRSAPDANQAENKLSCSLHFGKWRIPLEQLLEELGPACTGVRFRNAWELILKGLRPLREESIASIMLIMHRNRAEDGFASDFDLHPWFWEIGLFQIEGLQFPRITNDVTIEWKISDFIAVVTESLISNSSLDWNHVIRCLDTDKLPRSQLDLAFSALSRIFMECNSGIRLPLSYLVSSWVHRYTQTEIISWALANRSFIDWASVDSFPHATPEDCRSPYSKVGLMSTLIDIDAKHLLQVAVSREPDIVLLSLACARPSLNSKLLSQIIVTVLPTQISSYPASARTLRLLWNFAPSLMSGGLLAMWRKQPSAASLIVQIALDCHRVHDLLVPSMPFDFVLTVSMLSYKLQCFRLEETMTKYFLLNSVDVLSSFMRKMAEILMTPSANENVFMFPVDGVRAIFRALFTTLNSRRRAQGSEELKRIHEAYVSQDNRLSDLNSTADIGDSSVLVGSSMLQNFSRNLGHRHSSTEVSGQRIHDSSDGRVAGELEFSKDIEDEVNIRFHDIYKGTLSVDRAVSMLSALRSSDSSRDRKVFACMVHTLFDEYRFFRKYPVKELRITGHLFGALVQHSLFEAGRTLEVALERVLDALNQVTRSVSAGSPAGQWPNVKPAPIVEDDASRMTEFGLCALTKFRDRLHEWPQFCTRVLRIPHLHSIAPELLEFIEKITNSSEQSTSVRSIPVMRFGISIDPSDHRTDTLSRSHPSADVSPLKSENLIQESNLDAIVPDGLTAEKMSFIFNNLSHSSVEEKGNRLLEFIRPHHVPYFVDYVVRKRALMEQNHHRLYIDFLEIVSQGIPKLFDRVLKKSVLTARSMLTSEKITFNNDERRMLRTLGAWIGLLTLGRNRPILRKDLDLKKLCLEAYSKGRLFCVVPFVSKVLLGAKSSEVFMASNPWMRTVLSLLKEISQVEDLKLNLKFELPSLLSQLDIDTKLVIASNVLKDVEQPDLRNNLDRRKSPQASPIIGSPSKSENAKLNDTHSSEAVGQEKVGALLSGRVQGSVPVVLDSPGNRMQAASSVIESANRAALNTPVSSAVDTVLLPSFSHLVVTNMPNGILESTPSLKALLPIAIDRALRDIIQPVVERSCAIASLTTRELTLKDFAKEKNWSKIRNAALQMVQQLAGSLALVTCKEPLRVSIGNHVRSMLASAAVSVDPSTIDQAAHVVCTANLDLGCRIIEKAAKEKATRDLNDVIGRAFTSSRREQLSQYDDMTPPGPEVLRVYNEFNKVFDSAIPEEALAHPGPENASDRLGHTDFGRGLASGRPNSTKVSSIEVADSRRNSSKSYLTRATHSGSHAVAHESLHRSDPLCFVENGSPKIMRDGGPIQTFLMSPASLAEAMNRAVQTLNDAQSSLHNSNFRSSFHSGGDMPIQMQEALETFNTAYHELSKTIFQTAKQRPSFRMVDLPTGHSAFQFLDRIFCTVKLCASVDETCIAMARKVFKFLYEGKSVLHREIHVFILVGLRNYCRRLSKEIVTWIALSTNQIKFNRECAVALLRPRALLNCTAYDEVLVKELDGGRNSEALEFIVYIFRSAVIDDSLTAPAELTFTLESLTKIARRDGNLTLVSAPEGLLDLLASFRTTSCRNSFQVDEDTNSESSFALRNPQSASLLDPVGSREMVANILCEWQRLQTTDPQQHVLATFLGHIRSKTMSNFDTRERFCRLSVELVVEVTSSAIWARSSSRVFSSELVEAPFSAINSVIRLITALCLTENVSGRGSYERNFRILTAFMSAIVNSILSTGAKSDVRPHYELFAGVLHSISDNVPAASRIEDIPYQGHVGYPAELDSVIELWNDSQVLSILETEADGLLGFTRRICSAEDLVRGTEDSINIGNHGVLALVVSALKACAPNVAPSFAYCWLKLISSRIILARLLNSPERSSWSFLCQLIVSVLMFLRPHLASECELKDHVKQLYRGTLRILLIILHDCPKFLCDYYFILCNAVPENCIQLRNLILAAFPKDMRLPDPFRPDIQLTQLPDMAQDVQIKIEAARIAPYPQLIGAVDSVLDDSFNNGSISFNVEEILQRLRLHESLNYDIYAINEFVLYVGLRAQLFRVGFVGKSDELHRNLLLFVLLRMDAQGQYHVLNAIANHLRYPNSHTQFFSRALLHLFKESSNVNLKELVTRVLVERLIANRPHPWGLLVTFIDLIKNPVYNFWQYPFVRCAPQVENLFENVARFCIGPALRQSSSSLAVV